MKKGEQKMQKLKYKSFIVALIMSSISWVIEKMPQVQVPRLLVLSAHVIKRKQNFAQFINTMKM